MGHLIQTAPAMLYKMAPNVVKMLRCITTGHRYYVLYLLLYVLKLCWVPETDKNSYYCRMYEVLCTVFVTICLKAMLVT